MAGKRAARLEELAMVWDTTDAAFEQNLAAALAYFAKTGTLAAPRGAATLVGQRLTNLRRPPRARRTPDQGRGARGRRCRVEPRPAGMDRRLAAPPRPPAPAPGRRRGAQPNEIMPGANRHGDDLGRWLVRQQRDWARLNDEQRRAGWPSWA
ncbi:hypothetical protein ACE1OC_43300 (plasmid) [Streptomyces sp. DSM 116496]|uniref:hypothetical protein n=1 Tax=Streptomyces stoeckheimensis TaxID=3344656 RepID=UPI0038B2523E